MIYIMRRTQLYLEESTWKALHIRAKQLRVTISELVRQAVREKYESSLENRRQVMQAFVGLRKDRKDIGDSTAYIRKLRKGNRLSRLK
jgi:Ribbon-helix-helix protein, copG family